MTTYEIIIADVEQSQESLMQRSDVYNGKRVIIRPELYRNMILVCIKGIPAKDFPITTDAVIIADYIQVNTLRQN